MLNRIAIFVTLVLLAAIGAACNAANQSLALQLKPQSWIDAPLDGGALPLAPVDVISHSSDPARIVLVELAVNGATVRTDSNTDSAKTLVTMHQTWQPNAPGNYTLQVRAQNSSGAWGEYASANVTIGGAGTPAPSPSVNGSPAEEATTIAEAETATATAVAVNQTPTTSAAVPPTTMAFYSDANTLVVGHCTTLHWQIANAKQVSLDNALVSANGARLDCPRQTTTHTLLVVTLDNRTVARQLTIGVVPATNTPLPLVTPILPTATRTSRPPTATRTPTRVPTATFTPTTPTLSTASWNTNQFYWLSGGTCSPTAVTIAVTATDPGGIHDVQIYFWLADQSSTATTSVTSQPMVNSFFRPGSYARGINYTDIPGYSSFYSAWLRFYIVATNNNGARAQSATYTNNVTLTQCIIR